jgi:hypothetical protein
MTGSMAQPQLSHSVKGSSVSQIIRKREVCLRQVVAGERVCVVVVVVVVWCVCVGGGGPASWRSRCAGHCFGRMQLPLALLEATEELAATAHLGGRSRS